MYGPAVKNGEKSRALQRTVEFKKRYQGMQEGIFLMMEMVFSIISLDLLDSKITLFSRRYLNCMIEWLTCKNLVQCK